MVKIYGRGEYKVIPFPQDRKPIDIGDYVGDYKKIQKALHWQPETGLEEGLAKTLQYYIAHIDKYL